MINKFDRQKNLLLISAGLLAITNFKSFNKHSFLWLYKNLPLRYFRFLPLLFFFLVSDLELGSWLICMFFVKDNEEELERNCWGGVGVGGE